MRSAAIWILAVAVLLTLGSAHFFFKKKFFASGALLFLSLLGMVSTRHILRLIMLEGEFDPRSIPVVPQWTVFGVFVVCFALAIGAVAYMLKLYLDERRADWDVPHHLSFSVAQRVMFYGNFFRYGNKIITINY